MYLNSSECKIVQWCNLWRSWFFCFILLFACWLPVSVLRWFACVEKAHWTRQTNITYGFIRWCYKTLLFLFVIIVFILKNGKHTTAFLTVIDEENQRIQKPSSCYSFPLMKHLLRDGEKHCDFYPRANNSQQCVSYTYLSIHTLICSRLCVLCPPPCTLKGAAAKPEEDDEIEANDL